VQHNNAPIHELDISVKGNFSCKSGRALINAAKSGNGIVRLPELYCEDDINAHTLAPALISVSNEEQWHSPDVPLFLLYHRNRYQPARFKVLIDFICHRFQQL
jgi:DNA-binding transcriptional LysR family regulator